MLTPSKDIKTLMMRYELINIQLSRAIRKRVICEQQMRRSARFLISAFVVRCLDSYVMSLDSVIKISNQ